MTRKVAVFSRAVLFVVTAVAIMDFNSGRGQQFTRQSVMRNLPGGVKLEMVRIPAGSFQMGSPDNEPGRSSDEGPVHTVKIDYDFYIGKYEVTQAQWKAVMGENPVYRCGIGDDYPVTHISWNDCQAFIDKLNRLNIGSFRLPSEAEWEYACRAGTNTRFYFGNSLGSGDNCEDCKAGFLPGRRCDYMWYCGNSDDPGGPEFGARPVGQKLPNAFGLYDMHGNVWEWCQDEYHPDYNGAPTDGSAWQGQGINARVLRGGAWSYKARYCRSASRCGYSADRAYTFHGLRLVWFPYSRDSRQWYASWEAVAIADNIVSYQSALGGWPKNMHWRIHGYQGEKFTKNWGNTIDTGATYTEMNFLARVYEATGKQRFKDSFLRGLHFLLEAQYDSGGWPQRYPSGGDYGDCITFNDGAMIGVTKLMRDIAEEPEFAWLEPQYRKLARKAYEKALQCILDCQVVVNGRRTVWGQQHDPQTLQPSWGRAYEPAALCARESADVVLFLMSFENPSRRIIEAVEAAVEWYKTNMLTGIRVARKDGRKVVVKDPSAPPLWARFYEIPTARPVFCDRDGIVRYSLDEIGKERANGYRWYTRAGEKVLEEYRRWKKKLNKQS